MLRRFTQVYPSDTAYDADKGRVVKIEHMRLRFGARPIAMWLASSRKRVIDPDQIVFDPSCTSDPKTTVNLFRGLPAQPPGSGSCRLLLELIHYLCGEGQEDTETPKTQWLLRWIAYPLQHVGAKMQTAVVMHGEEGTGKNLVFGTVRKIYGRHGGVITQRQLEDKFNTWQSAKLFVVANEVVTRQEMSHQGGYIRNLITEPEVQINPKFQDQRDEANHMNIVFLANALQPLLLGQNDRRCFVIRTPNPLAEGFYAKVAAEVLAGGIAAFYKHLTELELGDFNEHTKPPMTDAKRALIELGMPTPQLFWQELKEGLLGLPYGPALATDLYKAYCVYCARNGYKMPEGMKFFSPNFMLMNGVRRVDRHVPVPGRQADMALVGTDGESKLRKRRVFLMGMPEAEDLAEKLRIVRGVTEFRSCLREYLHEEFADGGQAGHGPGEHGQRAF
jgi:putative DNA primase/helicase